MQHKNVGDIVVLDTSQGLRTWRIAGVYIGAVGQESVVGLEVMDRTLPHVGESVVDEMIVPEALVEGHVFRRSGQVA